MVLSTYFKFNALFTVGAASVAKEIFQYHFTNSEKNFKDSQSEFHFVLLKYLILLHSSIILFAGRIKDWSELRQGN